MKVGDKVIILTPYPPGLDRPEYAISPGTIGIVRSIISHAGASSLTLQYSSATGEGEEFSFYPNQVMPIGSYLTPSPEFDLDEIHQAESLLKGT